MNKKVILKETKTHFTVTSGSFGGFVLSCPKTKYKSWKDVAQDLAEKAVRNNTKYWEILNKVEDLNDFIIRA